MNPEKNTLRLHRDPLDTRELLTDTLGVTVEASNQEAKTSSLPSTSNLLGQRKREHALAALDDPLHRLLEEAFLYPVEPIPEPEDADFPVYDPPLPELPTLHSTSWALERLLSAIAQGLPSSPEPPMPSFRDPELPFPSLPDPSFEEG